MERERPDQRRDHPRVCGEKAKLAGCGNFLGGSPPRMRGKVNPCAGTLRRAGITPAYAGKSVKHSFIAAWFQDHPRVCGEKNSTDVNENAAQGSPPRMRGKDVLTVCFALELGITPAYAGKRTRHGAWRAAHRDHPRVCGEKPPRVAKHGAASGSPPRMRGKAAKCLLSPVSGRITPAYAGKSGILTLRIERSRDHPRVCGEKSITRDWTMTPSGSPPRMRGKASSAVW